MSKGSSIWTAAHDSREHEVDALLKDASEIDLHFEAKNPDYFDASMTALMLACFHGNTEVAGKLIKAGVDVNQKSTDLGRTALMWACIKGHYATALALILWGAKLDLQDQDGSTALMKAAANNRVETVQLLLLCGANRSLANQESLTAADLAFTEDVRKLVTIDESPFEPASITPAAVLGFIQASEYYGHTSNRAKRKAEVLTDSELHGADDDAIVLLETKIATPDPCDLVHGFDTVDPYASDLVLPSQEEEECAELEGECDALVEQVALAPARRDAFQQMDALQTLIYKAKNDYEEISTLGEYLKALEHESVELPLSEEGYLTLPARHAALLQRVEAKCRQLVTENLPELLLSLAAKRAALRAVDLGILDEASARGYFTRAYKRLPSYDHEKLERIQWDYETLMLQIDHARSFRALISRRSELLARLETENTAADPDFLLIGRLMIEKNELAQKIAKLPLSEEDYLSLSDRHAALVQQVQGMCADLVAARQYRLLRDLAAQLTALRALDLSVFSLPTGNETELHGEHSATGSAADPVSRSEETDASENDPVWVSKYD